MRRRSQDRGVETRSRNGGEVVTGREEKDKRVKIVWKLRGISGRKKDIERKTKRRK